MRILHVTPDIGAAAGGVSRAVLDSCKALAKCGAAIDIVTYRLPNVDLPWHEGEGLDISVHYCESGSGKAGLPSAEMKQILHTQISRCDILHLHGMWELLNIYAARQARKMGKPYVCSVHGMLDPWCIQHHILRKKFFYCLLDGKRLRLAKAVHFTAQAEYEKAKVWLGARINPVVVPCILDLTTFEDLPTIEESRKAFANIPAETPWVLFLSRVHPKKGLGYLIDAIALLLKRGQLVRLVIAGDGDPAYLKSLHQQVTNLGIEANVHFVGLVQGTRKMQLYRAANVLVIPTSQENFGLVFPESLVCETPVCLTKGVDIWQEIQAADAGYVITQDASEIADRLGEVLADLDHLRLMGKKGRQWVLENLVPEAIAKKWLEIYQKSVV